MKAEHVQFHMDFLLHIHRQTINQLMGKRFEFPLEIRKKNLSLIIGRSTRVPPYDLTDCAFFYF